MQNPRWKQLLTESLSKSVQENKDSVTYCLSTISSKSNPLPESRFIVHRGFVNERRKPDDPSSNSVEAGSSASLLACTDIRSPKVDQIIARNSQSVQEGRSASICWWLQPTGEQYRIQARAYIIPPPSLISKLPTFPVGQELSPSTSFDWEEERLRIFEKLSPDLKASFLRPPPGNELTKKEVAKDWPDKLDDEKSKSTALENFALIVFDPVSVDLVRLKTTPHERFKWARNTLGEWEETELVP